MAKEFIKQEDMMELLNKCYIGSINGLPGSQSCQELAKEYLKKYGNREDAAKKMIDAQIKKCATSGFLTSLGGLIVVPITIPANIVSVLYVQMRMIATLAVMGGYNLRDDEVQTLVYLSLVEGSVANLVKPVGVKATNKITVNMLKKLPANALGKINWKVGFRLITRFNQKGVIRLVKITPVIGGIVGGSIDYFETRRLAKRAYETFIQSESES